MKRIILILITITSLFYGEEVLKVGIKPSEPWVMYDKNATEKHPKGFSIDLWNEISKELGKKSQFIYFNNTKEIIDATKNGEIDAGIAAITITADREKEIDFSHSMYELGLQIMLPAKNAVSHPLDIFIKEVKKLFSLKAFLFFLLFLFLTINLRWLADRYLIWSDVEERAFSTNYFKGIYDAFWWAITMLVTWETPKSRGLARTLDLLWHIMGLIGLSILTAVVTSALTAKAVGGSIKNEKDLIGKYVGAVATDAPRKYLEKLGAKVVPVKTLNEGIKLLREGKIEALVHDGPRLVYLKNQINKREKKRVLVVLPALFNLQTYGIAFPEGSKLVEPVNRILLKLREAKGSEKSFHDKLKKKWLSN